MFVRALFDDGYVDVDCNSFDECPLVTKFETTITTINSEEQFREKFHSREFYLGGTPHPQVRMVRAMDALGCRGLREELLKLKEIKDLSYEDVEFLSYLFRMHRLPLQRYLCLADYFTEDETLFFWKEFEVGWKVLPFKISHFDHLLNVYRYTGNHIPLLKMMAVTFIYPEDVPSMVRDKIRDECKKIYLVLEQNLLSLFAVSFLLHYGEAHGFSFLVERNSRTNNLERDLIISSSLRNIYTSLFFSCDWSLAK